MKKKTRFFLVFTFLALFAFAQAPAWKLKVTSTVYLKTWSLTTKAVSDEKEIFGASIKAFKGSAVVAQVTSGGDGNFEIDLPGNGEYVVEVSYSGCNSKRFTITTSGVPEDVTKKEGYNPTFNIKGGFVMCKAYPGIDYSGLKQSLIKASYEAGARNFDDDEAAKNFGLSIVSKIYADENRLFENFCSVNRAGD